MEMETENGSVKSKMEDYDIFEQIGRGALGPTFLVLHKSEKKKYVLKKIRLSKQTEKFKRKAEQEIKAIAKLSNPYIVEYKDSWLDQDDFMCIVTGYCEGGDTAEMINKAKGNFFPEEKLCKWLTHMLLAMDYLHSNRIVHGDLKCSNILLTTANDIRLGDFGLAKILNKEDIVSSIIGTPNYMCPEILAGVPYGYKSDIWSLGCCVFEMAAHQPAFKAPDKAGLIYKIERSLISPLPLMYSSTLKQIIKTMLRKTPEHRPTAADLLRHPHLHRHLLRCHNPSSVFLPVFPISSPKDKTPKKSPSSKSGRVKRSGSENISQVVRSLTINDNQATSSSTEDSLEIKMVDPTSCARETSDTNVVVEGSIDQPKTNSETESSICNIDRKTEYSFSMISHGDEELAAESFDILQEFDIEIMNVEDPKMPFDRQVLEKSRIAVNPSDDDKSLKSPKEEVGTEPDSSSPLKIGKDDSHMDGAAPHEDVSLSNTPTKNKMGGPSEERGEALESLLELSAKLLKQDKLEDLAGLLSPFGEEAVSSRETAIWLTKSLISAQKLNHGS